MNPSRFKTSNCDICDTPTNIMFFRFLLKVVLCAHLEVYKSPFQTILASMTMYARSQIGTPTRDETTTSRLLVVFGVPRKLSNWCCCCPSITTDLILDSFFFFCLSYTLRQKFQILLKVHNVWKIAIKLGKFFLCCVRIEHEFSLEIVKSIY